LAPNDPKATPGCTGFEGIVTTAPTASIPAGAARWVHDNVVKNALGPAAADKFDVLSKGMKPDRWYTVFCNDATGDLKTGYSKCKVNYFFSNAYAQLVSVYGKGNEGNIPVEARDLRFLFKQWIFALVKYLQSADNPTATLDIVDAGKVDADNLFFDS